MDQHDDHADLIHNFYIEQKEIFDHSNQGIYAFLDDDNRVCNDTFAKMLGYKSAKEWSSIDVNESFPDTFIEERSQHALVEAFHNTMENCISSTLDVTWKTKSGGSVDTTVVLIPIMFQGHLLALHFVS